MRDEKRIPVVLKAIEDYWNAHPDLRLGQLISNAGSIAGYGNDPFHMEDEELLKAIKDSGCPACRDRAITSNCHYCGRPGEGLGALVT